MFIRQGLNHRDYPKLEGYYGILRCPNCGEYSHFVIVEDFVVTDLGGLMGGRSASGASGPSRKELFLVCDGCKMSYEVPAESGLRNLPLGGLGSGFGEYLLNEELWKLLRRLGAEFIEANPDPTDEFTGDFMEECLEDVRRKYGANRCYDRIFNAFIEWFCEQYGMGQDGSECDLYIEEAFEKGSHSRFLGDGNTLYA